MKLSLLLSVISALFFFTACNDGTKTSTIVGDTTAPKRTSIHDKEMMKPMDDMMSTMNSIQITGAFDIDFANMMIAHHQGAIGMAEIELSKGSDEKIKKMAQQIISRQKAEQTRLRDIVKNYESSQIKRDTIENHHQLQDAMANTIVRMKGLFMTGATDKDFVMMMIPHHESSNEMFKSELEHGKNKQLKQMAQKGIAVQKRELDEFQVWFFENK